MPNKDPEKRKAYHRKWKAEKRRLDPEWRKRQAEHQRRYLKAKLKKNHAWTAAFKKALGCKYCTENDPRCLDFHHRDPKTKLYRVSHMLWNSRRMIETEMAKCDVVCANCHRKLEWLKIQQS